MGEILTLAVIVLKLLNDIGRKHLRHREKQTFRRFQKGYQ